MSCPVSMKAGASFETWTDKTCIVRYCPMRKISVHERNSVTVDIIFVTLKNSFFVKVSVPASRELGGTEARLGILRAFLPGPHAMDTLYPGQQ
jgi:hypothetical protein